MRQDLETEISNATTLLDVLLILKKVTMLDTHVATLAFVTEELGWFDNYGIIKCKPFPLDKNQDEYIIQAYYFNQESQNSFNEGDIVVILFMDRNFINNLNVTNKNSKKTQDLTCHSLKFGVVINCK